MNLSKNFQLLLTLSILGIFSLHSCKEEVATENLDIKAAKKKWETSNISSYSFKRSMSCFCADISPREVTVTNKVITSVKNSQGQEIPFSGMGFKTVDEMFEFIETTLANKPYSATIEYNQEYGYPTDIYIDYSQQKIDEEVGYQIRDFQRK